MNSNTDPARSENDGSAETELARVDRELIRCLNRRAQLTDRLARERLSDHQGDPGELLAEPDSGVDVATTNDGPLRDDCLRAVFRELRSGIRSLWRRTRAVYLGPEYSYSHLAAVERFGSSAELVPVASITDVFTAVHRGQAQFGLVPMENSTDGRVADTLDMFARRTVTICGEVSLRIHHYLLGKCELRAVRSVYSKPQALSQCRSWLARQLPEAQVMETTSTAAAAQLAVEEPGAAAIASRQAGVNYGLDVIAPSIEDNPNNVTRFAVIGDGPRHEATGHDKTSLLFELPHRPGALADAMQIFKKSGLNLTWIESFPKPGDLGDDSPSTSTEYVFFVEFEGHRDQDAVVEALRGLGQRTDRLDVLGCYAQALPIG